MAVSDGVGGLADGAVASRVVVELLARTVTAGTLDERVAQARAALHLANTALFQAGCGQAMAATIVLAILGEGCAVCLWAGDSRAFLARDGVVHQITNDHSVYAQVPGQRAPRSLITRAVGGDEGIEVDCSITELLAGDTLLLASDGVFNALTTVRLDPLMIKAPPATAQQVVAQAAACGTRDDATAVVVRICPQEETYVPRR